MKAICHNGRRPTRAAKMAGKIFKKPLDNTDRCDTIHKVIGTIITLDANANLDEVSAL